MVIINANHGIFMNKICLDGLVTNIFIDNIKIIDLTKNGHISQIKTELAAIFFYNL